MNEAIWRLTSIWIAKESTPGTYVAPTIYIPLTTAPNIKQMVDKYEDESGIGRIEAISDKFVIKQTAETSLEWLARAKSFGHILLWALWTVWAPTLIETGVYKHSFTVKNDNNHPSYSFSTKNGVGQEKNTYNMLDKLEIKAEVENPIIFTADYMGKISETTTGLTVAYVTEEPFKVSNMTVTIDGATVKLKTLNLSIEKNVTDVFENGSITPSSFHNQDFRVSWDIELVYREDTFKTNNFNGAKKPIIITIQWDSLIGATKKNELIIELPLVTFDDWELSDDNNWLITQTFGITWIYSVTDWKMISASLQNAQSTAY